MATVGIAASDIMCDNDLEILDFILYDEEEGEEE